MTAQRNYTAFEGFERVASGELTTVAAVAKTVLDRGEKAPVLIFDDQTGDQIDVDFRGSVNDVLHRIQSRETAILVDADEISADDLPRGRGRPKLGVVAREVTLLPRHWEWLSTQPGGASVAIRKLVEDARRVHRGRDIARQAQEAAYRFLSALAGNLPEFEEATRALFANDAKRFRKLIAKWPDDVRDHSLKFATTAFEGNQSA